MSTAEISTIRTQPISGPSVWRGDELQDRDSWIEVLSEDEIGELIGAVDSIEARGLDFLDLTRDDYPLPILSDRLRELRDVLDIGRGFWLMRGLPVGELTHRQAALAYWGIGLHMGTPVSQNARGHLLGHVTDEGLDMTHPGTRGYQTRVRLPFHTDSSDVVGLLCLQPSLSGGLSSIVSSSTVFNETLARRPDLVELWFKTWHHDRRNEERPGEDPYFTSPLASWHEGLLSVRYVRAFMDSASRHDGVPSRTQAEVELLNLIDDVAAEDGIALDMDFRQGDIQFVCNYSIFHSRTSYKDHRDPELKRHLLRLWLALDDARAIAADFGRGYNSGATGRGGVAPVPGVAEAHAGTRF
jgi:hypothetical protein